MAAGAIPLRLLPTALAVERRRLPLVACLCAISSRRVAPGATRALALPPLDSLPAVTLAGLPRSAVPPGLRSLVVAAKILARFGGPPIGAAIFL
ncbi:MAG TPA: hypothetical protein VLG66_14215, partial [Alphaproteobacteria bacterium]|nr:hypothetical protein [Alphaproteobacteria bacterium]